MYYYTKTQQLHSQKIKIQQRIIIIVLCLLCVFVAFVILTHDTYGTLQKVQRSQTQLHQGDVHVIESWMTLPYIARQQQVPETLLYQDLHVKLTVQNRHLTLEELALQRKESAAKLIQQCQATILRYRKDHPFKPGSTPPPIMLRGEKQYF